MPAPASKPPSRPTRLEEALAVGLFHAISPRTGTRRSPEPPAALAPWRPWTFERRHSGEALSARLFPTRSPVAVALLLPPWQRHGQAWFHRRGRIEWLRRRRIDAVTLDPAGFGASGSRRGFHDRDIEDVLLQLRQRYAGLPIAVWGVSSGGYWAHAAIARQPWIGGAMFEDVSPHLLEWAWLTAPWGRPAYLFFRTVLRRAYRFLDARRHAEAFPAIPIAYVAGDRDRGIPPRRTLELARSAGAKSALVTGARHLQSMRREPDTVFSLAEAVLPAT